MNPGCYPDLMQKSLLAGSILTSAIEWIQCLPHGCSGDKSFSSVAQSRLTLCNSRNCSMPGSPVLAHQAPLSFTISQSLLKFLFIESVMPFNYLILCHPLLLLRSILPSIRVFSNESAHCIRWSKYWSFTFSISPFNEYSGLISFRIDWFDLLTVQGTLKNLHQHNSKA